MGDLKDNTISAAKTGVFLAVIFLSLSCAGLSAPAENNSRAVLLKVAASLVRFELPVKPGSSEHIIGTGFFYHEPTMVLSCAHNFPERLKPKDVIKARVNNEEYELEILLLDKEKDLAVLKSLKYFPDNLLVAASDIYSGMDVLAAGFPAHIEDYEGLYFTKGILSQSEAFEFKVGKQKQKYIMSDVYATTGNSGGPLINRKGEVIGMVKATLHDVENRYKGVTFITPVEEIEALIGGMTPDE